MYIFRTLQIMISIVHLYIFYNLFIISLYNFDCLFYIYFVWNLHFTFIYLKLITVSRSIAIYGTCKRLHERIRFEMSSAHKTHKAFMPNPKRIRWYERDKGKRSCQAHGQLDKLYILYCCKVIFYIYNVVNCTFIET